MRRRLGWFAAAVIVGMQAGTVFQPLGTVGQTRVADWVDLLTPFAVLATAAAVLDRAGAGRGCWILFGFGAITFTLGHGLHLSAHSVSNVADPEVAGASIVHLWDEVVSHWIWYGGLFLVMAALALAMRGVALQVRPLDLAVAAMVSLTLVNTYIEGGTPWLGLALLSVGFSAGLAWRPDAVARLMRLISGMGLLVMVGWGVYWIAVEGTVFPQFSELGWI